MLETIDFIVFEIMLPVCFFGGLLTFAVTSILWIFFNKIHKKIHYLALVCFSFYIYIWMVINIVLGGVYKGTYLALIAELIVFYTPQFIYASANAFLVFLPFAWLVVIVRFYNGLPNKRLLKYTSWITVICGVIVVSQFVLPCEFNPMEYCPVEIPSIPSNI